jgi:hypothetical protein
MPTTTLLGRGITLTIGAKSYSDQAANVVLNLTVNQQEIETITGRVYKTVDRAGTVDVELTADWGVAGGLCPQLWDATNTAPDTVLAATLAINGKTYSFNVYPNYPPIGGGATDVLTAPVSLKIASGTVTVA